MRTGELSIIILISIWGVLNTYATQSSRDLIVALTEQVQAADSALLDSQVRMQELTKQYQIDINLAARSREGMVDKLDRITWMLNKRILPGDRSRMPKHILIVPKSDDVET